MELFLILLITPFAILFYLILFGGKECYFCGHSLDEKERPIYSWGKRSCFNCMIRNSSVNKDSTND